MKHARQAIEFVFQLTHKLFDQILKAYYWEMSKQLGLGDAGMATTMMSGSRTEYGMLRGIGSYRPSRN